MFEKVLSKNAKDSMALLGKSKLLKDAYLAGGTALALKIGHRVSYEDTLNLYDKKFKTLNQNKVHILKSLQYFEDADRDEMPKMLENTNWQEIKTFFLPAKLKKSAENFLNKSL